MRNRGNVLGVMRRGTMRDEQSRCDDQQCQRYERHDKSKSHEQARNGSVRRCGSAPARVVFFFGASNKCLHERN